MRVMVKIIGTRVLFAACRSTAYPRFPFARQASVLFFPRPFLATNTRRPVHGPVTRFPSPFTVRHFESVYLFDRPQSTVTRDTCHRWIDLSAPLLIASLFHPPNKRFLRFANTSIDFGPTKPNFIKQSLLILRYTRVYCIFSSLSSLQFTSQWKCEIFPKDVTYTITFESWYRRGYLELIREKYQPVSSFVTSIPILPRDGGQRDEFEQQIPSIVRQIDFEIGFSLEDRRPGYRVETLSRDFHPRSSLIFVLVGDLDDCRPISRINFPPSSAKSVFSFSGEHVRRVEEKQSGNSLVVFCETVVCSFAFLGFYSRGWHQFPRTRTWQKFFSPVSRGIPLRAQGSVASRRRDALVWLRLAFQVSTFHYATSLVASFLYYRIVSRWSFCYVWSVIETLFSPPLNI